MWHNAAVLHPGPQGEQGSIDALLGVIPCSLAYRSIWLAWSGVIIQAGGPWSSSFGWSACGHSRAVPGGRAHPPRPLSGASPSSPPTPYFEPLPCGRRFRADYRGRTPRVLRPASRAAHDGAGRATRTIVGVPAPAPTTNPTATGARAPVSSSFHPLMKYATMMITHTIFSSDMAELPA